MKKRRNYRYYFSERTYLVILLVAGILAGITSELIYGLSFDHITTFFSDIYRYVAAVWQMLIEQINAYG